MAPVDLTHLGAVEQSPLSYIFIFSVSFPYTVLSTFSFLLLPNFLVARVYLVGQVSLGSAHMVIVAVHSHCAEIHFPLFGSMESSQHRYRKKCQSLSNSLWKQALTNATEILLRETGWCCSRYDKWNTNAKNVSIPDCESDSWILQRELQSKDKHWWPPFKSDQNKEVGKMEINKKAHCFCYTAPLAQPQQKLWLCASSMKLLKSTNKEIEESWRDQCAVGITWRTLGVGTPLVAAPSCTAFWGSFFAILYILFCIHCCKGQSRSCIIWK